ncbi:helix-turn-helix domain-containing protein [Aquamicrobium sp.]|uniref:helix-turn-helix domain-containing protein n=1 Tax=Aquamicrobium sp. TaxID=1872579 RepID=UPI0025875FAB|nr:helix-turn-helix domain-containing protein [Aquamicrobium sp.]MCK9549307.1 helix-turn-helix domain containing protein [Aquamicrobium sp.]
MKDLPIILNSADEVLKKLYKVLGIKYDQDFIKKYNHHDITAALITKRRLRNSIPYDIITKIAIEEKISLNWLLLNQGTVYLNEKTLDNTREEQ